MTGNEWMKRARSWWGCWPRTSCGTLSSWSLPINRYFMLPVPPNTPTPLLPPPFSLRTCPMPWTLPRLRTSLACIPYVTATGTSRPPVPPAGTASTRASTGWPISWRTRSDGRRASSEGKSLGASCRWRWGWIHCANMERLFFEAVKGRPSPHMF